MNANELADYLQNKAEVELNPRLQEAATMLRQLQAENEALKEELKGWNLAWYESNPPDSVKQLTNDEMRKVINEIVDGVTVSEMVTFLAISKAILRKAQEK